MKRPHRLDTGRFCMHKPKGPKKAPRVTGKSEAAIRERRTVLAEARRQVAMMAPTEGPQGE